MSKNLKILEKAQKRAIASSQHIGHLGPYLLPHWTIGYYCYTTNFFFQNIKFRHPLTKKLPLLGEFVPWPTIGALPRWTPLALRDFRPDPSPPFRTFKIRHWHQWRLLVKLFSTNFHFSHTHKLCYVDGATFQEQATSAIFTVKLCGASLSRPRLPGA